MFTAEFQGRRVLSVDCDPSEMRSRSKKGLLTCPACEAPLTFVAPSSRSWYFRHRPRASDCPAKDDPDYQNESLLHLHLKQAVAEWARRALPGASVQTEVFLPETGQFADVLAVLTREGASADRYAFEIQISPLTRERWLERRALYASAGVRDVWLLAGPKHPAPTPGETSLRRANGSPLMLAAWQEEGQALLLMPPETEASEKECAHFDLDDTPELSGVDLVALTGIADYYRLLPSQSHVLQRLKELRTLAYEHPPAFLAGDALWGLVPDNHGEQDDPGEEADSFSPFGSAPKPRPGYEWRYVSESVRFRSPLLRAAAGLGGAVGTCVWVSAEHRSRHDAAWAADAASAAWHQEWRERHAERGRRVAEREKALGQREERQKPVARSVARAAGEDLLRELRPALVSLARLAASAKALPDRALRSCTAIPEAVRKWRPSSWTPLADLDVPLDWIFGCDRRLWQMRIYCTQFSAAYAKKYRRSRGLNERGFQVVGVGPALSSLNRGSLMTSPKTQTAERALNKAKKSVEIAANRHRAGGGDFPRLFSSRDDLEGRPVDPPTLELHGLRCLAMGAYFEALQQAQFLGEAGYHHWRDDFSNAYLSAYVTEPCEGNEMLSATETLTLVREALLRWYGPVTKGTADANQVAAEYLELSALVTGAYATNFRINTPVIPPYFEASFAATLREALPDQRASFIGSQIWIDFNVAYDGQQRRRSARR
jgi:hypothetical protein